MAQMAEYVESIIGRVRGIRWPICPSSYQLLPTSFPGMAISAVRIRALILLQELA
jgi:hypothetical protein